VPDSHDSVIVEIEAVRGDGAVLPIPAQKYFQSLTFTTSVGGEGAAASGSISLFDRETITLEAQMLAFGGTRSFRLRWYWHTDLERGKNAPFRSLQVTGYEPNYTIQGLELKFDFVGQGLHRQGVDKRPTPSSWAEGTELSRVILDLAKYYGWSTTDSQGRDTVEPTSTKLSDPLSINDEAPVKFVRERVVPRATNENDEGHYFAVTETSDGPVVHFHSEDFLSRQGRGVVKVYVYGHAHDSEVISFGPKDNTLFSSVLGGYGSDYESTDSAGGGRTKAEDTTADRQRTNEHERNIPDIDSVESKGGRANDPRHMNRWERHFYNQAQDKPVRGSEGDVEAGKKPERARVPITARDPKDFQAKVKHHISQLRENILTATLEVRGTHDVAAFDLVRVTYILPDGSTHYMSGVYAVRQVEHSVGTDGWTTSFTLQRQGVPDAGASGEESGGTPENRNFSDGPRPSEDDGMAIEVKEGES